MATSTMHRRRSAGAGADGRVAVIDAGHQWTASQRELLCLVVELDRSGARRGVVPVRSSVTRTATCPSIHVADGGTAIPAVLGVGAGTYDLVDDEPFTKRADPSALARAAGRRRWLRGPGRLALLLGNRTTSLTRSIRVSNDKLRSATP